MVKWVKELQDLGLEEVYPLEFYRDIFPAGELQKKGIYESGKYCGIAVEIIESSGKIKANRYTITDELDTIRDLLESPNFVLLSPISYIGKSRHTENTRKMYAFALEIDNLKVNAKGEPVGLNDLLHQMRNGILPMANYIVTSGNGIHLYFIFDQPIRLFENVRESLSRYKRFITRQFWNGYITFDCTEEKIQYESAFQGFRLGGGVAKNGEKTRIFRLSSHPTTVEELNSFVYQERGVPDPSIVVCYDSSLTLAQAKEKYPQWYKRRVEKKEPKGTWTVKRDLYDWWLRRIKTEIKVGHRYHALMLLSIYAIKCDISYEELEKDCFSLLKPYDSLSNSIDNPFKKSDVMSALQVYQDKDYKTFPINSIEKLSGLKIERNKRNGRKQKVHLMGARAIQEINDKVNQTNWRQGNGRKEKKDIIFDWRMKNPFGRKVQCIRETGLSKPTVYKWWNSIPINPKGIYKKLSDIPFSCKKYLYKQIQLKYGVNKIAEKEKKELIRMEYIYESFRLIGIENYKIAQKNYYDRQKKKQKK